ncbi:MAG TPA: DMT family transporter [Flavobacteriales bacterium]
MVLVALSAALFASLFLLFKVFDQRNVPLFPAIVVNYITACLVGVLFSRPWTAGDLSILHVPAFVQGALFIGVFLIMGRSAQQVGVAITTVASKMSLVLTVLATVLFFQERPGALGWAGIALALVGVAMASWTRDGGAKKGWWMPAIIFFGSAMADILIDVVQRTRLTPTTEPVYPTLVFGASACIGLCILLAGRQRSALLLPRVLIGGAVLGLVNYGSIYFMVRALTSSGMRSSQVFPLMNIGAILFGTLASMLLFRERPDPWQRAGIATCVIALVLLLSDNA